MEGKGFGKRVIDFTRQLIKGRDQLANNSQKKLDKWGDSEIEKVTIIRKPIMAGINKLANFLTKGQFTKDMLKNGYDDMFHLRVDIKLKESVCLTIEKNETLEISRGKCENLNKDGLESRVVEIKKPITLKEAYDKMTKGYPNNRVLYSYDSVKNNCQRFVDVFLSKNKDAFNYTAEDKKFVKQDVKFILDNYKGLKKGARAITGLAQRLTLFMTGGADNDEEMKDLMEGFDTLSFKPTKFKVPTRKELMEPHKKDYKKPKSQKTFFRPVAKRPNEQQEEKQSKRKTDTEISRPKAKRGGIDLSKMFGSGISLNDIIASNDFKY